MLFWYQRRFTLGTILEASNTMKRSKMPKGSCKEASKDSIQKSITRETEIPTAQLPEIKEKLSCPFHPKSTYGDYKEN